MARVGSSRLARALARVSFILAVMCLATPAAESQVLDQSYEPPGPFYSLVADLNSTVDWAQTIPVGISGQLVQVDVKIADVGPGTGDLVFDVRPTVGGVPVENDALAFGTLTIPENQIPPSAVFFSVDVSSFNAFVQQGDVIAVVLNSNQTVVIGSDYDWLGETGDPYPAGTAYVRSGASSWSTQGAPGDLGFRTFINPPEPPDLTNSFIVPGTGPPLACPAGDGALLGQPYEVWLRDAANDPVFNYPADLITMIFDPSANPTTCTPATQSADGPTDATGKTTISWLPPAGGQFSPTTLQFFLDATFWTDDVVPAPTRSPDITGDLSVDLCDLNLMLADLAAGSGSRSNLNQSGGVDASDLAAFVAHYCHRCAGTAASPSSEGEIGVYFDPAGTQRYLWAGGFQPFPIYVVARNVTSDVSIVEYRLTAPAELNVNLVATHPQVVQPSACGSSNCTLAFGDGCISAGSPVVLAEYFAFLGAPVNDLEIALVEGGNTCAAVSGARYGTCGAGCTPTLFSEATSAFVNPILSQTPPTAGSGDVTLSNAPNPFNPSTTIYFDLPERARVDLDIFDIAGRHVRSLLRRELYEPGRHHVLWDGRDSSGRSVSAGIYPCRLLAGQVTRSAWMTVIK